MINLSSELLKTLYEGENAVEIDFREEGNKMIKVLIKRYLMRKYNKLNLKCNELEEKLAYTGYDSKTENYYINKLEANRDLAISYSNAIKSL